MFHYDNEKNKESDGYQKNGGLATRLTQPEPLKAIGQVAHEFAFTPPAERFTPCDHRGQSHHDRRQAKARNKESIECAETGASGNGRESSQWHGPVRLNEKA